MTRLLRTLVAFACAIWLAASATAQSGDKIEFSFKVTGQIEGVITYTGTTDGKTMKGKVDLAGAAEGTFTGKKK